MVSVSGSRPLIKKIFKNLPYTSYGKDCLFERLLKLKNLKILSLGLGTGWAPFFHYVENLANVPYRFKKKTIQEDYFLIINSNISIGNTIHVY